MRPETVQDCWKRIGVQGDKSCPELPRHIHCRNCQTFEQVARASLDREPPAGYVEEWARLLACEKAVDVRCTEAAVVFRIGAEWLALAAGCWVEVVSVRPIRRVPHRSNRALAGLVSVRGEILLCFSLGELLGLSAARATSASAAKATPRLIVARKDRFKLAFPVEEALGLHRFTADAVEPVPATNARAAPRFCRGLLSVDGRQAGLLDEELVFRALEKELA